MALCLLFYSSLSAQSLTLPDLLKIHGLDSTAARNYCAGKKLPLVVAGNTGSNMRYRYAVPDSSVRLEISYPNDSSSLNTQMSYWFTDAKQYKELKEGLRKDGFRRQSAKETGGSLPAYAERYVSKDLQAELIRAQGKQPYWLFLHPVGNYSW